jgi:4-methylaminobutanoate oxidase (formaldehyde-forming)
LTVELPRATRIVVVGGGVIGTCLAWWLGRLGCSDVVLLEQGRLGCGTSWHSAGNIIRMNTDPVTVEIFNRSHAVIAELSRRHDLGWRECGRLMLARGEDRLREFDRIHETLARLGVDSEIVGPDAVADKLPFMNTGDVAGAIWSPGDGRVDPTALITAYAREARANGLLLVEGISARRVLEANGRVSGVLTDQGQIDCEIVVNCTGMWAREFGLRNGVDIPLYAVEHFYLLSEAIDGVYADMPTFRDPDGLIYGREEVGGLLLGCFDRDAVPVRLADLPQPFEFGLLNENWDQFGPYLEQGVHRVPALAESGIRCLVNGPESFTPDAEPHMDQAPGIANYFVLAGLSSTGITRSGGMAAALARWILDGDPGIDVRRFSLRRFCAAQNEEAWLREHIRQVPAGHFRLEA